ncbi:multiple antibiotic resistance regulatory protein MarB [Dryocola clanedunensis]|uniref:multiple antibiotic resistance regulatory protein MarB n=1 Tax=Cedecea sulfonylureivorans TaxID=3051154 RepID=UPI001928875F|nr:multiple antibiotic resistance regulatory protein MarB [Cedecea sulfonylureivorans]
MKRFISAAAIVLALVSGNALAEQSGSYNVTQARNGGMIIPPSDNHASNTISDKSEHLGTPYYNGNE